MCEGADRSTRGGWTQKTIRTWAWRSLLPPKSLVSTPHPPSIAHCLFLPLPLLYQASKQVKLGSNSRTDSRSSVMLRVWTVESSFVVNIGHILFCSEPSYDKSLNRWLILKSERSWGHSCLTRFLHTVNFLCTMWRFLHTHRQKKREGGTTVLLFRHVAMHISVAHLCASLSITVK